MGGLYTKAFSKQKIKIKRKGFDNPWMTKGLWKSSKKKQRLYENFWRMGTMKRNWIIYNTKHFSSLWKRNQEKNYYSDLTDSYKYNIKKMLNVMKEIIG